MKSLVESSFAQRLFAIVGMATAWLPILDRLLYPISFTFAKTGDVTAYAYNILYYVLVIITAFVLGLVASRFRSKPFENERVVAFTGVAGAVGVASAAFLDFSSMLSCFAIGIGMALFAVYVPVHFLFWSSCLSKMESKSVLADSALSFLLISVVTGLYLSLGFGHMVVALAAPLVSAGLGFAYVRSCPGEFAVTEVLSLRKIDRFFLASLILILLCNVAVAYFNNDAQLQGELPYRALTSWGQAIVFALIAYLYAPNKTRKLATVGAFALVSITFVGTLFLAIFVSGDFLNIGTVPLNCANAVLMGFAWLLLVRRANKNRECVSFAMSLYLAFVVLLPRFAQACIMYRSNYLTSFAQSIDSIYIVCIVAFLVVGLVIAAICMVFVDTYKSDQGEHASEVLPENASTVSPAVSEEHMEDARRAARFEAALASVKEEADLSDREMDVVRLALKGFTAKKMAQTLYISENTVYSHLKHVYRKTGVHSKQEFIDLVEERFPDTDDTNFW